MEKNFCYNKCKVLQTSSVKEIIFIFTFHKNLFFIWQSTKSFIYTVDCCIMPIIISDSDYFNHILTPSFLLVYWKYDMFSVGINALYDRAKKKLTQLYKIEFSTCDCHMELFEFRKFVSKVINTVISWVIWIATSVTFPTICFKI